MSGSGRLDAGQAERYQNPDSEQRSQCSGSRAHESGTLRVRPPKGKDNKAAIALLTFLKTDKAKAVIRSFGYQP